MGHDPPGGAGVSSAVIGAMPRAGLIRREMARVGHFTAFVGAGIFGRVWVVRHNTRLWIQDPQPIRTE